MPWTKEQLQVEYSLTDAEVIKTLKVCHLPVDQLEYSEIEIESTFKVVRSYFDSNRTNTYTGAADLFELEHGNQTVQNEVVQLTSGAKTSKAGKDKKLNSSIDNFVTSEAKLLITSELLALACEQCGTRISLKEAAQILDSCGLPDTDEYTSQQGDRFLEACDLIKKQNKTYEEVAVHFGVGNDPTSSDHTLSHCIEGGIETSVEEVATNLDLSSNGIVSEMMRSKAKADASAASSMYFKHLADEFASPEFHAAWHQVESVLKAKVVGKSQLRARQVLGEIRAIPPSHSPSNVLPEATDNGSTSD